jgi:hypothetical protein
MKNLKLLFITLLSINLLFLTACGSKTSESKTEKSAEKIDSSSKEKKQIEDNDKYKKSKQNSHGGQVVEEGKYHLELVAHQEEKKTYLHLFLEDEVKHQIIPNAKVTGKIQLIDGNQKSLDFKYQVEGEHYSAILPSITAGEYQVKITTDISGDKVNGHFSLNL